VFVWTLLAILTAEDNTQKGGENISKYSADFETCNSFKCTY